MIGERDRPQEQTLRDIREQLRAYEDSQLAAVAETLARTADTLSLVQERQDAQSRRNLVTEEDLARELGYVNERGEVERKQFVQDMVRCGVERHKTSRTRAYYFRDEVEAAIRSLGD